MTRLEQYRDRRAKLREAQTQLEATLDDVIPSLSLQPSAAFEALLAYAVDGLVAQGTMRSKQQALYLISKALTKHGMIG
ncbi:hypothetical protein PMNALOAF_1820 [Methylobacterium adhaesivum]|uniref:Uncharacterized protein n=1 Tax=Methylobacterium adhaesivum TaxID=333297 RepID=A0ABT8BCD0_9HYPH|nr:hypothetical protein [Methylobacterium adhaesivum]MDN3589558.1 hypothetical protein [Methylobacterium adhaesivum]GJD30573.1 hypothetical protein PMNALOAF_1820 [Methylobacterium adhaesivum]